MTTDHVGNTSNRNVKLQTLLLQNKMRILHIYTHVIIIIISLLSIATTKQLDI